MMNAKEARTATLVRIEALAQEFIWNNVGVPLQRAIDNGRFYAQVSLEGVASPKAIGAAVVKLLEEQGYTAEHVYYDGPNGYDNYILIKWEEADV